MSEHTPTPWTSCGQIEQVGIDQLWCGGIAPAESSKYRGDIARLQSADHIKGISADEARANAAFIIKAVNSHDEAIGFLEMASKRLWKSGDQASAHEIDRFLERVASGGENET